MHTPVFNVFRVHSRRAVIRRPVTSILIAPVLSITRLSVFRLQHFISTNKYHAAGIFLQATTCSSTSSRMSELISHTMRFFRPTIAQTRFSRVVRKMVIEDAKILWKGLKEVCLQIVLRNLESAPRFLVHSSRMS